MRSWKWLRGRARKIGLRADRVTLAWGSRDYLSTASLIRTGGRAERPPSGEMWLHEIKHDGFRVIARKEGARVKLYSRPGNDLTYRFPLIVEALARLRSRSCIIDGEAVACGDDGVPSFDRIRYRRPLPLGRPHLGREGFEPRL